MRFIQEKGKGIERRAVESGPKVGWSNSKRGEEKGPKSVVLNLGYLYPQGVRKLKVGGTRHAG